jgi:hypothetical protein
MAEKGRLTVEHRVQTVLFAESKSIVATQRGFRASVLERKRGRALSVRTAQNIDAVRVAIQRSPGKSTRRASAELTISRRSVQRILHSDLYLYPYKMSVMQKLTDFSKQQILEFCTWAEHGEAILHNVWFSDEAHFHLDGVVNRQNVRFWGSENPHMLTERMHYAPKITVWAAISSHGLIGPFFFDQTVNSERYLSMLRNNFVPQLIATGLPLNIQWFMQDGATPHTANTVLDFLHENFGPCVISHRYPDRHACRQLWPPNSPDLNPCDFFLWGFFKEKLFPQKPTTLMQLRALVVKLCSDISEDMCHRVIMNMAVRLTEVVRQNGGHIEHVLRKN